ncbi:MAG: CDGSH iron-sulfur domain-containing protein [Bacteroidia bacterium]|nr:CDGSH iron-sulfur domain-containing protein [Bacteroidia bacterium]MDW8015413.1 CDGSH iron-sulfur domain-containing protein [Bacteroidia bacterium]
MSFHVPQKAPYGVQLNPGTYYWCACGRSAKQPFCDGSHRGTGFSPIKVSIDESKKVWFCGCKHTKTPPFCDGTHRQI